MKKITTFLSIVSVVVTLLCPVESNAETSIINPDTIKISGEVKNCAPNTNIEFSYFDICTGDPYSIKTKIDVEGHFNVAIPVYGNQDIWWNIDGARRVLINSFDPGKTYRLFQDISTGEHYFVGEGVQLQNEIFKYGDSKDTAFDGVDLYDTPQKMVRDSMTVLYKKDQKHFKDLIKKHPELSDDFKKYRKASLEVSYALDRLVEINSLDINLVNEIESNMLKEDNISRYFFPLMFNQLISRRNIISPIDGTIAYSLVIDSVRNGRIISNSEYTAEVARKMREDGILQITDEELAILETVDDCLMQTAAAAEKAKSLSEFSAIQDEILSANKTKEENQQKILDRVRINKRLWGDYCMLIKCIHLHDYACQRNYPDIMKDMIVTQSLYKNLKQNPQSITPAVLAKALSLVSNEQFRKRITLQNEIYLNLEGKTIASNSIKDNELFKEMKDGKDILDKIIAPYRGRYVYLDIWGTWCAPCKQALSESKELKEKLKDYDIVYLYLASKSSDGAWKNVIKEYHLDGENNVHYNLPAEQQSAIERYLNVTGFPTYKLFDKTGKLCDRDVDARLGCGVLINLLEHMEQQ